MYQCKVCGGLVKYARNVEGTLIGWCCNCESNCIVVEVADFDIDYDPDSEMFYLNDRKNFTVIVLTKEQLEVLMEFYKSLFK